MSNTARIAATAANTLTKPLNVEDVFSTYLWTSDSSSSVTVNNGIDLDGEGGMVWIKSRSNAVNHVIVDTERVSGTTDNYLMPNLTNAQTAHTNEFGSFTSTGFTVPYNTEAGYTNFQTRTYASWTFRKAPKFFDVVTWTGDGTSNRQISHNLGTEVGSIFVKRLDSALDWRVYHRELDSTSPANYYLVLNGTAARAAVGTGQWQQTTPTSTYFTVGNNDWVNASGGTYVAYLFAHNDGDGDFGSTADQDIIKCGSYTGNGSTTGPEIDLGFEPQWIMIKDASAANDWVIQDVMRGIATGGNDPYLHPNSSSAETGNFDSIDVTATGFKIKTSSGTFNDNGNTHIYIAIRRGPMAVPTDATDVFAIDTRTTGDPNYTSNFPVDWFLYKNTTGSNSFAKTRLTGNRLKLDTTEAAFGAYTSDFAFNDGVVTGQSTLSTRYAWMFRRAPSFFDVVAYTGNGTAGRTVSHNLGVAPEMIWVKRRDAAVSWPVFHTATGSSKRLFINSSNAEDANTTTWNAVDPTASNFTVGNYTGVNASGGTYIAYLFASLDGVSKVGSYAGNGSSQNIDCGFSSGARFVLIKSIQSGSWYVFDSERGIVAGNDGHLLLNNTDAEAYADSIDPYSSGFTVVQNATTDLNKGPNDETYIFYAIA